jgi:hypothetical protein
MRSSKSRTSSCGWCGSGQHRELLHGRDDDADEQVEDGEGGDDDEGHEKGPGVGVDFHHRAHDAHRPAFEGHDLEQRIQAAGQRAEPVGEGAAEQARRQHPGGEEEDRHHRDHPGEPGIECRNAATTLRSGGLTVSRRSTRSTRSERSTAHGPEPGNQRHRHHQEIEDIPAAAPETPAVAGHLDRTQLDQEHRQAQPVERDQQAAPARHDFRRGFQAEDHRVGQDDRDDPALDDRRFNPAGQAQTPGGDAGLAGQVLEFRVAHMEHLDRCPRGLCLTGRTRRDKGALAGGA